MSYTSFDPRSAIRSQIGYTAYVNEDDVSTVSVTDDWGDTVYIPMYLPGEVRTGEMPEMPFIEMKLVNAPTSAMNIGADVRDQDCYIDFHVYYANSDHVTPTTFGRTITDEIVDLVTIDRCNVSGCSFMEVVNDGVEYEEYDDQGKAVVFHRVVELHCKNYNSG